MHPCFSNDEYIRFVGIIGQETAMAAEPEFVGNVWQFKSLCPGRTDTGCAVSYKDRPIVCKLYPFLPVPTRTQGIKLLLDIACPNWKTFGNLIDQSYEELKKHGFNKKTE
jgi:Fe-S-cluster containining protein